MSKYYIETISPIHIGNGNKYTNKEFIIQDKMLMRAETGKIYETIENDSARDDFILFLEEPKMTLKDFTGGGIPKNSRLYTANLACEKIPSEISEFIKTCNTPFIPGSSIKGSIRTIFFYSMMSENDIGELRHVQKYMKNTDAILNKIISGNTRNPSYSDLLKFLQISDSNCVERLEITCEQTLEAMYNGWNWYNRNNNIVQTYIETIPENTKIEGDIAINSNEELIKKLGLYDKGKNLNFGKIKEMVYNFSKDIINYELEFAEKYNIDFLTKFYENAQKLNSKDTPLLKIGHGAGFMAMTIGLKLKNDSQLFEKIRIMTKGKTYQYEFPKTRKIDVDKHVPLGWCKLEIK